MDSPPELRALYEILLQRWKLILACCVAAGLVGVAFCATTPKEYESTGRLLVMQKLAKFVGDKGKVLDPKAYDSLFATHLQLIGSPRIIQRAVESHDLEDLRSLVDAIEEPFDSVADVIAGGLRVSRAGSGDSDGAFVIRLAFRHVDAEDAEKVVRAILETYQCYIKQSSLDGQQQAVSLIAKMESDAAREVQQKAKRYRSFLRQAPGIWNRNTLENPHQDRIDGLQIELTELESRQIGVESRIQIMRKTKSSSTYSDLDQLALIDDMHVARLTLLVSVKSDELNEFFQSKYPERQEHANARYDDLLRLQRERSALAENLGRSHPSIQELNADIRTLEAGLAAYTDDIKTPDDELKIQPQQLVRAYELLLKNDLEDVKRRIEFVTGAIKKEEAAARKLMDVSLEGEQLQHDYERSRELYRAMLDLLREQSLVNDFGDYVAEILASPRAGEKVWPNVPMLLAIFVMLGFLAGVLGAIVVELPVRNRRTARALAAQY